MLAICGGLDEGTIVAIRLTKDFLSHYEKVAEFPISKRLVSLCATARQKCNAFLEDLQKERGNWKKKVSCEKNERLKDESI